MRADDSFEKIIMHGKMEGKRGRGRPRTRWWDNILARVGRPPIETIRTTTDRSAWRQLVNMVTRGQIDLMETDIRHYEDCRPVFENSDFPTTGESFS